MLPGFRRWQANREVSGHEHRWSGACGQAGSVKIYRHTRSPYVRGHAWQRSRDQLLQPGHRRLPARRRPPRGRRRRGALQPASSTQGLPGLGDRLLLAVGFLPAEISHSGTNLADRGFGALLRHPGVRLNLDLVRQVERLGRQPPGRDIGLRLNPRAGAFSERTRSAARYPGPDRPAKSGIDALPGQLGRTPLLRGSSRLRADRPARRRTAVPDHHRAGRTRLDRDRDQPSVQVNGAACSATSGWSRNR